MDSPLLLLFASLFCISSRALLNLLDRTLLGHQKLDLCSTLFWNALHPFVISLIFCGLTGGLKIDLLNWFLEPGMIWGGFAAQLTASAFSNAFRSMPVRSVVVSSKMSDLFIPIGCFLVTQEIPLSSIVFNQMTTLVFIPLAYLVVKQKSIQISGTLLLIGSLLLQAILTSYFQTSRFSTSWEAFLQMVVCLMGWRVIFISTLFCFRSLQSESIHFSLRSIQILFGRGLLAYFAQASFFYCMTFKNSLFSWSILNTGPLLSCFAAALFLKEEVGKVERYVGLALLLLFFFYLLNCWR